MRERIQRHTISFAHAFAGLSHAFRTQPNFVVHFLAALGVIGAAAVIHVSLVELIILLFCVMLVLLAELINTSVESVVDLVTSEWRQEAKIAKDVSAGMVLFASFFSVIIGVLIFGRHLL